MKNRNYTGMNLPATLLAIFVTLKLTDNIDWSWWWVLAPLWIPVGVAVLVAAAAMVVYWSATAGTKRKIREMLDRRKEWSL